MKNFLEREKFNPSFLSIFFHPFYFIRRELFHFISDNQHYLQGDLLDFGSGSKPYKKIFNNINNFLSIEVLSDKNNLKADIYYDGINLPFANKSFDSILCTEVFEHVENLDVVIDELKRILKPSGKMIITTPFLCIEHEMPNDFRRISFNGLVSLMEKKNFKIIKKKKLLNNFHVIFQTINFYFCQLITKKKNKFLNLFYYFCIAGPINLISLILNIIFPKLDEMYFGTGIVVEKND